MSTDDSKSVEFKGLDDRVRSHSACVDLLGFHCSCGHSGFSFNFVSHANRRPCPVGASVP